MAEDLLGRISAEIDARRAELRPLLAEYEQLLAAAAALEQDGARAPAPERPSAEKAAPARARRKASGRRGSAAGAIVAAASLGPPRRKPAASEARPPRAARGAAQQAILAALEHGSHTVSELSVVTAMSGANIRESLRRMLAAGAVTRAKREGKAAYALPSSARR